MKKYLVVGLLATAVVAVWVFYQAISTSAPSPSSDTSQSLVPALPQSPLDATYRIGDQEVTLVSGLSSTETAPGSASTDEVRVWGEPVMGDVDGDGQNDAALILTETSSGSGTFYYATVALADDAGYLGMNAVYLGDRIALQTVEVRDEMIVVNYAERTPDQSFTDAPSVGVSARLTLVGAELMRIDVVGEEGEQVFAGGLVYGHEVRTFTPCGGEPYALATTSRARAALEVVYQEGTRGMEPYTPLYLVVSGVIRDGVKEGFASEYPYSIDISQILSAPAGGTCSATSTLRTE